MSRAGCAIGIAAVLAAGAWSSAALADEPLVKAVAVPEQEIYDDGTAAEHRFPYTPADGVDPKTLSATLTRVHVGQRPDVQRVGAFYVEVKVLAGEGPAIIATIQKPDLVAQPATYELEVVLKGTVKGAEVTQPVTVKLVHPAARLRQVPALVITRDRLPVFDHAWNDYPHEIELAETSRRSRLTGVTLRQLDTPLHNGEPVQAGVRRQPVAAISAGSAATVPIALEGSFPIGTTKGRLEVSAPQLDAPMQIEYEVRARVPTLAIPFVFLAGVAMGQLIRGRWLKKQERTARKLRAMDIRDRLERLAKRSEADDAAALQQQIEALDQAKGDDAKLDGEIVGAEALLASTLAARAKAQQDLLKKLARDMAVLDKGWVLPPVMVLPPVADALGVAQHRAAQGDLVGARKAEREAEQKIYDIAHAARRWAGTLDDRLPEVEELFQPAPVSLSATVEAARASCAAIDVEPVSIALEPLLLAAHRANDAGLELAEQIRRKLSKLAADAVSAVPEHAAGIRTAANLAIPGADQNDAERVLGHVVEAFGTLDKELRAIVSKILPEGFTIPDELEQHLEARRYSDALRMAQDAVKTREPEDISSLDGPEEPLAAGVKPSDESPARPRGPQPVATGITNTFFISAGAGEEGGRAALERQYRGTEAIRTWAACGLLAAITWALYDSTFIGTTSELLTLFGLGFSSDLSADAVAAAFDRAKKT